MKNLYLSLSFIVGVTGLSTAAFAGCETNINNGRVYCGIGDCATNKNNGKVYCSMYTGGGAARNARDGKVYCGEGPGRDTSKTVKRENCEEGR